MTSSHTEINATPPVSIDESRNRILDAIGQTPEMTLVRPFGNNGDELIWTGTRELLRHHLYREVSIDQLSSASGELAVLSGGGAWSRRYNEFMPEALAIAEQRFERVIVLPSTFEVSEDRVRAALERSDATVFARELKSFGQIQGLCRARLAHDCAFFADLSSYDAPGEGELNAFRVDDESLGLRPLPPGNTDISDTAESLEAWLREIESHAVLNTDRAHVMIAGAMMGKRVNYASSSYFKVEAIAEFALGDYDVHPIGASNGRELLPALDVDTARLGVAHSDSPARVAVAVLSRDKADGVVATIDSVLSEAGEASLLVLDRNSRPRTRAALEQIAERSPQLDIRLADRDSGAAASLRLATEITESEYVMFLSDRMRLTPGSLERLVAVLDEDPSASAVTPAIINTDGGVSHCGGWMTIDHAVVGIERTVVDETGVTGWVPTEATLFRRSFLQTNPFAGELSLDFQNADWCLRAENFAPRSLRACPDAKVIADSDERAPHGTSLVERASAVRTLPGHARFHELHGRLLAEPLMEAMPELRDRDGALKVEAAGLLMAIVAERGPEWVLMEWMNGGLDPLLQWRPVDEEPELSESQRERLEWLEARNERLVGIENGGWWKLRDKLDPLRKVLRR